MPSKRIFSRGFCPSADWCLVPLSLSEGKHRGWLSSMVPISSEVLGVSGWAGRRTGSEGGSAPGKINLAFAILLAPPAPACSPLPIITACMESSLLGPPEPLGLHRLGRRLRHHPLWALWSPSSSCPPPFPRLLPDVWVTLRLLSPWAVLWRLADSFPTNTLKPPSTSGCVIAQEKKTSPSFLQPKSFSQTLLPRDPAPPPLTAPSLTRGWDLSTYQAFLTDD